MSSTHKDARSSLTTGRALTAGVLRLEQDGSER